MLETSLTLGCVGKFCHLMGCDISSGFSQDQDKKVENFEEIQFYLFIDMTQPPDRPHSNQVNKNEISKTFFFVSLINDSIDFESNTIVTVAKRRETSQAS